MIANQTEEKVFCMIDRASVNTAGRVRLRSGCPESAQMVRKWDANRAWKVFNHPCKCVAKFRFKTVDWLYLVLTVATTLTGPSQVNVFAIPHLSYKKANANRMFFCEAGDDVLIEKMREFYNDFMVISDRQYTILKADKQKSSKFKGF